MAHQACSTWGPEQWMMPEWPPPPYPHAQPAQPTPAQLAPSADMYVGWHLQRAAHALATRLPAQRSHAHGPPRPAGFVSPAADFLSPAGGFLSPPVSFLSPSGFFFPAAAAVAPAAPAAAAAVPPAFVQAHGELQVHEQLSGGSRENHHLLLLLNQLCLRLAL